MSVASRRRQAADVGGHDAAVDTDPESLAAIAAAAKAPTPRRRQWVKTAMLVVAAFVIVRTFAQLESNVAPLGAPPETIPHEASGAEVIPASEEIGDAFAATIDVASKRGGAADAGGGGHRSSARNRDGESGGRSRGKGGQGRGPPSRSHGRSRANRGSASHHAVEPTHEEIALPKNVSALASFDDPDRLRGPDPDTGIDVRAILEELGLIPTLCMFPGKNISATMIMSKEAVEDGGHFVRYTNDKGKPSKLVLEDEFLKVLGKRNFLSNGECHTTCAIVGNSGALLKRSQGADIDAHDAVLRINYPPVSKFKAHVGIKTTYDFSNRENARRMLRSRIRWRNPRTRVLFFEGASPVNRRSIFGPLLKKYPDQEFAFLHPHFVNKVLAFWFKLKSELQRVKGKQYHNKPMSGIYAVIYMLQVCEQVDLYGFEAYTRPKDTPYHYFDSVKGVTSVHSFDLAIGIYKAIASALPLAIK